MRLVLISIDALSALDTEELLKLPNIKKLAENGVFSNDVRTVYPTLTYPIHTSIITGCYPDRHGIAHNEHFVWGSPKFRPWYWEAAEIKVPTLFTAAYKAGREVATLLWPVTGKSKSIKYNLPEIIAFPWENQITKVLKYGSKWWLIKTELMYGKYRNGIAQPQLDSFTSHVASKLIYKDYSPSAEEFAKSDVRPSKRRRMQHMPDIIAMHLVAIDSLRHEMGVKSEKEREGLIILDMCIGRVLEALSQRDAFLDTVVCVVSDHGQENVHKSICLNTILRENSIPAEAQSLGFGAYIHIERENRRLVYEHLNTNKDDYCIEHVYSYDELRQLNAPEGLHIAVEMQQGVEALDYEDQPTHKATHGFGLQSTSAKTLLWLMGPCFKKNIRLNNINIVDIAPTLARAIDLPLNGTQGRVLNEAFI